MLHPSVAARGRSRCRGRRSCRAPCSDAGVPSALRPRDRAPAWGRQQDRLPLAVHRGCLARAARIRLRDRRGRRTSAVAVPPRTVLESVSSWRTRSVRKSGRNQTLRKTTRHRRGPPPGHGSPTSATLTLLAAGMAKAWRPTYRSAARSTLRTGGRTVRSSSRQRFAQGTTPRDRGDARSSDFDRWDRGQVLQTTILRCKTRPRFSVSLAENRVADPGQVARAGLGLTEHGADP
jgi:hypothetical protein